MHSSAINRPRRPVSPSLAALLSFLWPGLGQLYAHRRRSPVLFGGPVVVLVVVALYEARDGLAVLVARLLDPVVAAVVFVAVVALGAWRLISVLHAFVVS